MRSQRWARALGAGVGELGLHLGYNRKSLECFINLKIAIIYMFKRGTV